MRTMMMAGACALAMAVAIPAQGAVYGTFTLSGYADGDIQTFNPALTGYRYDVQPVKHGFFRATFDVRLDPPYASSTYAGCASFLPFCGVSASGNTLTFFANPSIHRGVETVSFVLCLTGMATVPMTSGVLGVDSSCSSGSFRQGYTDVGLSEGTVTSLDYASLTVYGTDRVPATGYLGYDTAVAFTPEPATWATMLLGFGMAGYALRRRRGPVSGVATA